ncbi:hypothetical protein [Streptomyces sp. NPDC002611]
MSDLLKHLVETIRQQESLRREELKGEVRELVAQYRGSEAERQAELDQLVEEGEYEGTYHYDVQLSENETGAASDLRELLDALTSLVEGEKAAA